MTDARQVLKDRIMAVAHVGFVVPSLEALPQPAYPPCKIRLLFTERFS